MQHFMWVNEGVYIPVVTFIHVRIYKEYVCLCVTFVHVQLLSMPATLVSNCYMIELNRCMSKERIWYSSWHKLAQKYLL